MRRTFLLTLIVLLGLTGCEGQTLYRGTLITGDTHTLLPGEAMPGELVITEGVFVLPEGALLEGSIYILGGTAQLDGTVTDNVSLYMGDLSLGAPAVIEGTLNITGGTLDQDPAATILGDVTYGVEGQFDSLPADNGSLLNGGSLTWLVIQGVLVAALAGLLAQFAPRKLSCAADAVRQHPVASGAMGLLLFIVGPALLVFMALTILLIPLTMLGILGGILLIASGWCATGVVVGNWLAARIPRPLPFTLTAFSGTLLVVIGAGLLLLLPIAGSIPFALITAASVGSVALTRFGWVPFVPALDRLDTAEKTRNAPQHTL